MLRQQITAYLNNVIIALIYVVVGLTPLLFGPFTTEFFESPKLILLAGLVSVLLVLWSLKWVIEGKVTFTKTPLDLPLVLFLIILLLSTFFSESRFVAILGNFPRVHGSLVSWVIYILFYFVIASNLKTHNQVKGLYYLLITSTLVVVVMTLLSYFRIYLPIPFAQTNVFTPTGAPFATNALLILLLPFSLLAVISPNRLMPRWLGVFLTSIFALTIILTGSPLIYIVTVVVGAITILTQKKNIHITDNQLRRTATSPAAFQEFVFNQEPASAPKNEVEKGVHSLTQTIMKAMPWIVVVVPIVCLVVAVLSFVPLSKVNPFYDFKQNYPTEIQLPFSASWKVSATAFRDTPFLGTGPSTYLFNFTQYKPAELNTTPLWSYRFDQGFNEYLNIFGTLGILGIAAFAFLMVILLILAWRKLSIRPRSHEGTMAQSLSLAVIAIVLLLAIHASTVVVIVVAFTLIAMFMTLHREENAQVEELSIGIKAAKFSDSNLIVGDILPVIIFIPVLIFVAVALFNTVNVVRADYYHRAALNAAQTKALDTYNNLVLAEKYNPWIDLYRTDLAQTNFALANAIAINKGPNEASPEGSLSDEDKQNIQQLLQQAINEGRSATTLSPRNPQNWEILASIYRQITGVAQNALEFSFDAYGRAIQRDPMNPVLRLNVGGLYYSLKNYDMAIRFFSDAVSLKPDFANAYYNLAIALREKGDLQGAQQVTERVVALLDPKSEDYKVASKLLADLKDKTATLSGEQSGLTPETSNQSAPLQKENLPNVVNLPKDKNLSTPSALTSPTPRPTPSVAASPSPSPAQ